MFVFPYEELVVDLPIFLGKIKVLHLTEKSKKQFEKKRFSIPLRLYVGWPNGELEGELIRYIPHIISE